MQTPFIQALTTNLKLGVQTTLKFGETAAKQNVPGATEQAIRNPNSAFGGLITQILNIVLTVGMVAVLLFLIWGGIEWITAGGDSGKITKAREKMTGAVIGVIVLVSTAAIMMFIQQLLGVCIINFGDSCTAQTQTVSCASLQGSCVPTVAACNGTLMSGACSGSNYCCKLK